VNELLRLIAPEEPGTLPESLTSLTGFSQCTQEHLATLMGVTSATIIQVIDELYASGLIFRGRDPADRSTSSSSPRRQRHWQPSIEVGVG
jgi:DNA-binding MarR family transcriptional regulator